MNDGTCNDGINSFNCSCVPGYVGDTCETGKINDIVMMGFMSILLNYFFLQTATNSAFTMFPKNDLYICYFVFV